MKKLDVEMKLDELLSKRESLTDSLQYVNRLIKEGIKVNKGLPERWYVENPDNNVIFYLEDKYKKELNIYENCGYGELHGEYAFIPADINYSWLITQEEFYYAISLMNK